MTLRRRASPPVAGWRVEAQQSRMDTQGPPLLQRTGREQFLFEAKATKGSRFDAAKRLEGRHKRITAVTAVASTYIIILTFVPTYAQATGPIVAYIGVLTIALSAIILTSSLLQNANNDQVKAEQLHRCAMEISAIRRKLRSTDISDKKALQSAQTEYDRALMQCSVNHDDIDFDRYKIEHEHELDFPMSRYDRWRIRVSIAVGSYWHYICIAFLTGATLWLAIAAASGMP